MHNMLYHKYLYPIIVTTLTNVSIFFNGALNSANYKSVLILYGQNSGNIVDTLLSTINNTQLIWLTLYYKYQNYDGNNNHHYDVDFREMFKENSLIISIWHDKSDIKKIDNLYRAITILWPRIWDEINSTYYIQDIHLAIWFYL